MRTLIEDISGVPTRYHVSGTGELTVLLLHGVGVSSDSWLWNMRALSKQFRVIAPDMLGFGMTGEGSYRNGPPQAGIVDHLVQLVEHLETKKLLIVGSSFGSNIACHLYWRLKSATVGLALVGCGPALNSPSLLQDVYGKSYANGIVALKDPNYDVCLRRMRNLVFNPSCVPEALIMLQMTLYALPGAVDRFERRLRGLKSIDGLIEFDVTKRVRELNVPTLIVWGEHDNRGDLTEAQAYGGHIPHNEFIIYKDCGHLPYLEYPDRFSADLTNFVSKLLI